MLLQNHVYFGKLITAAEKKALLERVRWRVKVLAVALVQIPVFLDATS
jgi:hypothetical protein